MLTAGVLYRGLPTLWSHSDAHHTMHWSYECGFGNFEDDLEEFFPSFYYMNDAHCCTVHHSASLMMHSASSMTHCVTIMLEVLYQERMPAVNMYVYIVNFYFTMYFGYFRSWKLEKLLLSIMSCIYIKKILNIITSLPLAPSFVTLNCSEMPCHNCIVGSTHI